LCLQDKDHPAIVIYALVGNDVCNELSNTVDFMTSPEKV
jgi:acyloxyacyl hydrolase